MGRGVGMKAVATLSMNIESLGYAISPPLFEALARLSKAQFSEFEGQLIQDLTKLLKGYVPYRPMYAGFPTEVMKKSRAALYVNALIHYWSGGSIMPPSEETVKRLPLARGSFLVKMLGLGDLEEFETMFTQIVGGNMAFSPQDREDIESIIAHGGHEVWRLLPETIPQRENVASVSALMLRYRGPYQEFLEQHAKTATDALRIAVALSGGDVSLASPTKFSQISRPQRRQLLSIIERSSSPLDDMVRRPETWKRFGERLHPGEFHKLFPKAYRAMKGIRQSPGGHTFRAQVESSLRTGNLPKAVSLLTTRPGELARRLDHLLRSSQSDQAEVVSAISRVADQVSTPVLLQALHHFRHRNDNAEYRVFLPKGEVGMTHCIPNNLPELEEECCQQVTGVLEQTLIQRFGQLQTLGNVFLDERLKDFCVPSGLRSASKSLRTVGRGSRLALPQCDTLRFFIWWKNGVDRTDIDLSAVLLNHNLGYEDYLTYYNLRSVSGCHSGDIVDAPEGACEFIDINISEALRRRARYVAMIVKSYTRQPYCDLPECFAGYMARTHPASGEVFEARTVQDRFDLASKSRTALPLLFDLQERVAIWCDVSTLNEPEWNNNVHTGHRGILAALWAMTNLKKMSIYDLLWLHATGRGTLVQDEKRADTVFSVAAGTQFEVERIAAEFMA